MTNNCQMVFKSRIQIGIISKATSEILFDVNNLKPHTLNWLLLLSITHAAAEREIEKFVVLKWKLEIKYFGLTLFQMRNIILTWNKKRQLKKKNINSKLWYFCCHSEWDTLALWHKRNRMNLYMIFCVFAHNHRQSQALNICQVNTNFSI